MGTNTTCIAVKSKNKTKVLKSLKLKGTGLMPEEVVPKRDQIVGGYMKNGWYLILDSTWKLIENQVLFQELSEDYEVIFAEIGEGWNGSSIGRFYRGKKTWSVSHLLDKGEDNLETVGSLPAVFKRVSKYQSDAFSIPIDMLEEIVGFSYCKETSLNIDEYDSLEHLEFKSNFPAKDNPPSEKDNARGEDILKRWKVTEGMERFMLAGELVKSKVLNGKSRREVVEILGLPKNVTEDDFEESNLFLYPCSDEWNAGVHFDSQGKYVTISGSKNYSKEELDEMYSDFPEP